jgi:hypothetical protein
MQTDMLKNPFKHFRFFVENIFKTDQVLVDLDPWREPKHQNILELIRFFELENLDHPRD